MPSTAAINTARADIIRAGCRWSGTTLLEHSISACWSCSDVVVVMSHDAFAHDYILLQNSWHSHVACIQEFINQVLAVPADAYLH